MVNETPETATTLIDRLRMHARRLLSFVPHVPTTGADLMRAQVDGRLYVASAIQHATLILDLRQAAETLSRQPVAETEALARLEQTWRAKADRCFSSRDVAETPGARRRHEAEGVTYQQCADDLAALRRQRNQDVVGSPADVSAEPPVLSIQRAKVVAGNADCILTDPSSSLAALRREQMTTKKVTRSGELGAEPTPQHAAEDRCRS